MSETEVTITIKIHVYPLHGKKMTMKIKCFIKETFKIILLNKNKNKKIFRNNFTLHRPDSLR